MELFVKYPEITVAIISLVAAGVGYAYRARKEKKENLNVSLYLLLEIWHRFSVLTKVDFDAEFEELIKEISNQIPDANINEDQKCEIKKYFTPILIEKSHKTALSDFTSYAEAFDSAIIKLSKDLPFLAYKINSSSRIRKFFSCLEEYLVQALAPLQGMDEQKVVHSVNISMQQKAREDALSDLENDIKILSFEIGPIEYIMSIIVIRRRHKKLKNVNKKEVKDLVKEIIVPLQNEFNNQINRGSSGATSLN